METQLDKDGNIQFNLNICGQQFAYIAFMSDTPSAAGLFNQLQYSSHIDGEAWKIERDIKTMQFSDKITITPADRNQELPAINRKVYGLPTFNADSKGLRYIDSRYGDSFTDAARAKIRLEVEKDIADFIAQQFNALKHNAREKYRERLKEAANQVIAQCEQMKIVVDKLTQGPLTKRQLWEYCGNYVTDSGSALELYSRKHNGVKVFKDAARQQLLDLNASGCEWDVIINRQFKDC